VDPKEKRRVENELMVMGLAGLEDPELIDQMARLVSEWPGDKHDFLRDLLNECDQDKRYEMYEALRPKLKFKALAFSQYEAQIALKAGAAVSRGHMRVEGPAPKSIEIGGQKLAIVPRQHSEGAVATVRCHRCPKTDQFLAATPTGAMIAARTAGWVRDKALNKETCPECAEALAATVVRLSSTENLAIFDRRSAKLDA
jgi:hypothetical protein